MSEPAKTLAALAVMAAMSVLVIVGARAGRPAPGPPAPEMPIVLDLKIRPPGHRVVILPEPPAPDALHRYGGTLDGVPECPTCRKPYAVILTIDARDPALDYLKLPSKRLLVLTCLDCDVYTRGTLFYQVEPQVRIVEAPESRRGHPIEKPCPPRAIGLRRLGPDDYPDRYGSVEDWQHVLEGSGERKHQLGGPMYRIRGDHRMICPTCRRAMRFVAQIETETWVDLDTDETSGHSLGPRALLYVRVCDDCGVYGTGADVP